MLNTEQEQTVVDNLYNEEKVKRKNGDRKLSDFYKEPIHRFK